VGRVSRLRLAHAIFATGLAKIMTGENTMGDEIILEYSYGSGSIYEQIYKKDKNAAEIRAFNEGRVLGQALQILFPQYRIEFKMRDDIDDDIRHYPAFVTDETKVEVELAWEKLLKAFDRMGSEGDDIGAQLDKLKARRSTWTIETMAKALIASLPDKGGRI
jgi:hypothetical protein